MKANMKAKSAKLRIETGIVSLLLVAFSVTAQVPSSITGKSFGIRITGGTFPFAAPGYYLFLPASSGNTYQVIGIYNVANSSGTYLYTPTSATTATVIFSDSVNGTIRGSMVFAASASGSFHVTADAAPGAYQDGNFEMFSGAVPTSLAGKKMRCLIDDGLSPFAFTGSFTFVAAASGNTYSIIGDGVSVANSSGTYSYSLINSTTGSIQISDSISGLSTVYVAFSDANTGGYAIKSSNGFQIGHFELLPSLQISRSGNRIVLSWPTNAVGFTMEYATNLPATSWISNSSSPAIVSGQYNVTNTISDNARFYRLQKPQP